MRASQQEQSPHYCITASTGIYQEVIFTKRGLGYFVSKGAKDIIRQIRRREFIEEVIPDIIRTMQTLGISKEELLKLMGDQ